MILKSSCSKFTQSCLWINAVTAPPFFTIWHCGPIRQLAASAGRKTDIYSAACPTSHMSSLHRKVQYHANHTKGGCLRPLAEPATEQAWRSTGLIDQIRAIRRLHDYRAITGHRGFETQESIRQLLATVLQSYIPPRRNLYIVAQNTKRRMPTIASEEQGLSDQAPHYAPGSATQTASSGCISNVFVEFRCNSRVITAHTRTDAIK